MTAISLTIDHTGTLHVTLAGDIDFQTTPRLRQQLVDEVRRTSPARVCIDLAAVTFLDSAGISGLVGARQAAHDVHATFEVINAPLHVDMVLRTTGLAEHFGLLPPVDPDQPTHPDQPPGLQAPRR